MKPPRQSKNESTLRYLRNQQASINILDSIGIPLGEDFHVLSSHQVDALLSAADKARYRKPKTANGSRARYFHGMLQRRARDKSWDLLIRIG